MTRERGERLQSAKDAIQSVPKPIDWSQVENPHKAFQAVSCLVKEAFPADASTGDELSFWPTKEPDSEDYLEDACRQFERANITPNELAGMILNRNPRIKTALTLGNMTDREVELMQQTLAEAILPHYSRKFQIEHEYNISSGPTKAA